MLIQLERISAQHIRRSVPRCTSPRCTAGATWMLVDREMPDFHAANVGERPCCAAHITATYLNLRGANVVSRAADRRKNARSFFDRPRKPKRMSLAPAAQTAQSV